jgi:two-component system NtrC family sensor kinase
MKTSTESIHVVAAPTEGAQTLRSIVEIIRTLMLADVASILGFSLDDETVSWKAAAGFRSPDIDYGKKQRRPDSIALALQALVENRVVVYEGAGSTSNLPLFVAEGIEYLAVAPLRISGNRSGVVTAGFRTPHRFTDDEKTLLKDLAEMASLTLDNARLREMVGETETRLRLAHLFAHIGTFDWDIESGINTWSPELEELYGLPPGEHGETEMVWVDFVHPDDRASVVACMLQAFETRQPVEAEWRATRTDGSVRWLLGRFQLFSDEAGRPVRLTGINIDITDRKVAEATAREMQEQLAKSQRLAAIGQLAAGVAHEVNNPLATITTCAEGMIRDMRDPESKTFASSKRWDVYVEEIVRQAMRCKQITRGLLDLTRQREPKPVLCDINALVSDCIRVATMREGAQVEFRTFLESNSRIATDPEMVRQILVNLLGNAMDAIAEGANHGTVTASTSDDGERVVIEIADTGGGVSPDVFEKIFDPFFSTKKPSKGYGLGLPISLSLAESLGGGLSVESEAGKGSTFRLWLPQLTSAQAFSQTEKGVRD